VPIQLDRRTERDEDVEFLSPRVFFGDRFGRLAELHGRLVADAIAQLGGRPLSLEVDSEAWSIVPAESTVRAVAGVVDDALVVTFTPEEFSDWCQNQRSLNSFLVARSLQFRGGDLRDVSIWDSLLLTLLHGWPAVGSVAFLDRVGAPLDLRRCFTPNDAPADIAHFLREAGFLHLRGWVDPVSMALISDDMDRVRPSYVEGDGRSWWAEVADGPRVCVRMQEFVQHSPTTAAMMQSDLWRRLLQTLAAEDPLEPPPVEGRCIEALVKPVGVVSGPSDLSFHRDCHLDRHAYQCSHLTIGVSITASDESNGQLRVIPGSHRIATPVEIARTAPYMEILPLSTQPGDLTVHLSCTLHDATPPVVSERRVMYAPVGLASDPGAAGAASAGARQLSVLRERVTDILREKA